MALKRKPAPAGATFYASIPWVAFSTCILLLATGRGFLLAQDSARPRPATSGTRGVDLAAVLIHEARLVDGTYEMGPVLRNVPPAFVDSSLLAQPRERVRVFDFIETLPLTERTRLAWNRFAPTLISLDLDGDGTAEKVFLSIELGGDGDLERRATNRYTGETEVLTYRKGLLLRTVSSRRITEVDYGVDGIEVMSRTFVNAGTLDEPVRGQAVEETRTVDIWFRPLNAADVDPSAPLIAKLRVNFITGTSQRETYGLFPQPVETADGRFVTRTIFAGNGLIGSATVFENGLTIDDFDRPEQVRLSNPIVGRERYRFTAKALTLGELSQAGHQLPIHREDLVKGLAREIILDVANASRPAIERFDDPLGEGVVSLETRFEYSDGFMLGLLPARTTTLVQPSGTSLSTTEFDAYDAVARELRGTSIDWTGKETRITWNREQESPWRVATALRTSETRYSRDETAFEGQTIGNSNAEEIESFSGSFDRTTKMWRVKRSHWFRPGILLREETQVLSPFGRLVSSRDASEEIETRPIYDDRGFETSRITRMRDADRLYTIPLRTEDDYQRDRANASARVQTFLDGTAWDEFRIERDAEGRLLVDGIREVGSVRLRTANTFDRASHRILRSEVLQNDQLRVAYAGGEVATDEADGTHLQRITASPFWGLKSTATYRLGQSVARPLETTFENGNRITGTEWFAGTAVPKKSVLHSAAGKPLEEAEFVPNAGVFNGLPYDVTSRYKTGVAGERGLMETVGRLRGTEIVLFRDSRAARTHYDLQALFDSPAFSTDLRGQGGVTLGLDGSMVGHVTRLFQRGFEEIPANSGPPERVLALTSIELDGLFYHSFTRQRTDRAGAVIDEQSGRLRVPGPSGYHRASLLEAVAAERGSDQQSILARHYEYEPGWLVETMDQALRVPVIAFMKDEPASEGRRWAVNRNGWRELPTSVAVVRPHSESGVSFPAQRFGDFREFTVNPFLPDRSGVGTAWRVTHLDPSGGVLHSSERLLDAQGRTVVVADLKRNSAGHKATHVRYALEPLESEAWSSRDVAAGANRIDIDLHGLSDFSDCDFLALHLRHERGRIERSLSVTDRSGRTVSVGDGPHIIRDGGLTFWPVDAAATEWFPNATVPAYGATVSASGVASQGAGEQLLVVSVAQLNGAGINVSEIQSAALTLQCSEAGQIGIQPLRRLMSAELRERTFQSLPWSIVRQQHSSGLTAVTTFRDQGQDWKMLLPEPYWNADIQFQGQTVAVVRPRFGASVFPAVDFHDRTDPAGPSPLYSIGGEEGGFLEYYRTSRNGDARVYSITNGFTASKFEVFRSGYLDDEISPGVLAYGEGYRVRSAIVKNVFGNLRNRMAFSIFKVGGDRLRETLSRDDADLPAPSASVPQGSASEQARQIDRLPMLAESILARRDVPWVNAVAADAASGPALPEQLGTTMLENVMGYAGTSLIRTSPDSLAEPFIDTVTEGLLIELATRLQRYGLAGDVLEFYWNKSRGGTELLCASYDARNGASTIQLPRYERPSESPRTAGAQLAIARAAFALGAVTKDEIAIELGRNLLSLVLRDFRALDGSTGTARGISETVWEDRTRRLGLTSWPLAKTYLVETNARAYLLLKQALEEAPGGGAPDEKWVAATTEALREQEAWLRSQILTRVEASGVVPNALVEIQDIGNETTAEARTPWSGAGAWLAFVEAAHVMGIAPEKTRGWLENLARVHGVTVNGTWGLDWTLALTRGDAISTYHTAAFASIARRLGHGEASRYALSQLSDLPADGWMPVAATAVTQDERLPTGLGTSVYPSLAAGQSWPPDLSVYRELGDALDVWAPVSPDVRAQARTMNARRTWEQRDLKTFSWAASIFYLSILVVSAAWWLVRGARERKRAALSAQGGTQALVSRSVMQLAEERWVNRVLGGTAPPRTARTRCSNAPLEGNFIIQLKAIYKLVMEWRRQETGRETDDRQLAEGDGDEWMNGADEFIAVVSIYMRWVIKAGKKDGLNKENVLEEHEDSNHIWSRLVLYFSEYYWGVLTLLEMYRKTDDPKGKIEINQQMILLLNAMGMRQRREGFDGRELFNHPENKDAFDLLAIQKPGADLESIIAEMIAKLRIPRRIVVGFIRKYKDFKRRERPEPVHPYLLEAAKLLPHFIIMALLGVVWFNTETGGLRILQFLQEAGASLLSSDSLVWAVPLALGYGLGIAAHYIDIYRYRASMRPRPKSELLVFSSLTSLFTKDFVILPITRPGRRWDPSGYAWWGWLLRVVGFVLLGRHLLLFPVPSFAAFIVIKGLIALLLMVEAAAILLPLVTTWLSKWLTERVHSNPNPSRFLRFLDSLNITPTRPASFLWLSIKYHYQFSVPSGGLIPMVQAVVFYFAFAAAFILAGGYILKEALGMWFVNEFQEGSNFRLLIGGIVFLDTMYLLRFGLYVLISATAALVAAYPFRAIIGLLVLWISAMAAIYGDLPAIVTSRPPLTWACAVAAGALVVFEEQILRWLRTQRWLPPARRAAKRQQVLDQRLDEYRKDPNRSFGVVYMSGDDLSYHKLNPELMMSRWNTLEKRLGSKSIRLLTSLHDLPGPETIEQWMTRLYELEQRHDVTLWHPMQLVVGADPPRLPDHLGLNLHVADGHDARQLLSAWHVRRWLVTMMSTAGHSQDTGINLIDMALRLEEEALSPRIVFYLIQNKYDDRDDNRPLQMRYDAGELGQRDKLAKFLMQVAPGSRAYSLNDWTPFGFKAGGLIAMDLVHEEAMNLTNMLVMDRNANVHDLDALMEDIVSAIADPGVVNVIPGRSTTNTLTPIGQGSQALEEGHRQLIKGVMLLGGRAGEAVGTGWGNIQAIYYGRVQRAMMDLGTSQRPLTTRQLRGCSFGDRFEGMIGFAPHAVGISEDTWAVTQATHNAIALGIQVKFAPSRAIWHKVRESWSHADWFAAFPRWAGGYLQMMHDPLMQRINEDGPLTVFAKEVRANNGRFFLSVPFAIFNILFMPLAIIWGVSPFVQILVILWNVGFIMNQVLTALGLVACLEATGFSKAASVAAAILAGVLAPVLFPALIPWCPVLIVGGLLAGGFSVGLTRWLYDRGRDLIMFGPQLVIHAIGQFVRQSLEFVVSGAAATDANGVNMAFRTWAGPREHQPWSRYPNIVSLRTLVWSVGLVSFVLNLLALAKLDFLNVLLLLPSLLFSVSCLVGPFLMQPKPGRPLGSLVWLPKTLGWVAGVLFYTAISWMVSLRGWPELLGAACLLGAAALLISRGLQYLFYPSRMRKCFHEMDRRIRTASATAEAPALRMRLIQQCAMAGDIDKAAAMLGQAGITGERAKPILDLFAGKVVPLVKRPLADAESSGVLNPRATSEFRRSLTLSLFTFVWFLFVPVPGLLVFSTGSYRFSFDLYQTIAIVLGVTGAVLLAALAGRGFEQVIRGGLGGLGKGGLNARIGKAYQEFRSRLAVPGELTLLETASVFALFTDVQTYLDQRGYHYLRHSLEKIERTLDKAVPHRKPRLNREPQ